MNRVLIHVPTALLALSFCLTHISPSFARGLFTTLVNLRRRASNAYCIAPNVHGLAVIAMALMVPAFDAVAQTVAAASETASISSAALPAEITELRREGNEAMYNIDYATAKVRFEEIKKRLPQHPAGDLYLATVVWLEHLNKSRRLQTGLYRDESNFYAGAENAKEDSEGDAVDAAVDRAFRDRMNQAKTKALALVAKDKNDVDAHYFLGAYYGVMAGYEASTARKFFSAMRNGSRCVDEHQKTLKLKPDYYDAYLSVGMYDYVVGNLPFAYKALAVLGGIRGNKQRGIERLQTLVSKETATSDDARVLLLAIYQNEKRFAESLTLLEDLNKKYPNSYLLKLETASTQVTLGKSSDAYQTFEGLLNDPAAATAIDLVHFQYAEALAREKDYRRAAEHFLAVPEAKGGDPNLATFSMLRAGQILDLAGDRDRAVATYKAVLSRPNVYDTRQQAEKGINKPFAEKEKKA